MRLIGISARRRDDCGGTAQQNASACHRHCVNPGGAAV
jgi:hypothetical protein